MATSFSTSTYNRRHWEDSDFPILCQTCLGDNPYIRMIKEKFGRECKICTRPFTVFRWCPGARSRYKKTEICQTCSKLKNICQTCMLDLEYGLPVEVRDRALKLQDSMPKSDVNKEYYIQNVEKEISETGESTLPGGVNKTQAGHDMLMRLARTTPYYKRNRPHICSFWVKGECRRGEECPYRHDKPSDPDDPLSFQNFKDRYYGLQDPVAAKLMREYTEMPKATPPSDPSVTTLYIGGLGEQGFISEKDIRDYFYQFGEVRAVTIVAKQQCAFVQFTKRESAERAVDESFSKLIIKGRRLNINWGKPHGGLATKEVGPSPDPKNNAPLVPVPGLPAVLTAPSVEVTKDYFNLEGAFAGDKRPAPPGDENPKKSMHEYPVRTPFQGYPGGMMPPPMAYYNAMMPMFMPPPPPGAMPPRGHGPLAAFSPRYPNFTPHYPSQDPSRMGSAPEENAS